MFSIEEEQVGQVYRLLSRTFGTIESFEVELLMFKSRDEAD